MNTNCTTQVEIITFMQYVVRDILPYNIWILNSFKNMNYTFVSEYMIRSSKHREQKEYSCDE